MKISFATMCSLFAVGGVLLWLNLRIPAWVEQTFNTNQPPDDVDPITKFLFFRGWPFNPCLYSTGGLSTWHNDWIVQFIAFADIVIFVLLLAITGVVGEWCWRFLKRRNRA